METTESDTSSDITLAELFKKEKEKEQKEKRAKYNEEYNSRPTVKKRRARNYERISVKRTEKKMAEKFKNLGKINPHKICKKLGSAMNIRTKDGEILYKCKVCDVSYKKEQEKYFWRNHYCPCCHRKLRTRKPTQWKKIKYNKK